MITYKSINQINASLDEREKYLKEIENEIERPSVFLQTCNRVEVYEGDGDVPNEVARHLFRVVSGLESALIGERAVQGQVKEAYINARNKFKLPAPAKLFEYALLVGKRYAPIQRFLTVPSHTALPPSKLWKASDATCSTRASH